MRVLLGDNRILVWSQNQTALALVFRATNAPPVSTAILAIQVIVDHNQWFASLAVNEIHTLKEEEKKEDYDFTVNRG